MAKVHLAMSSPECLVLTAFDKDDENIKVEEHFWKSVYHSEADRELDAHRFIETMTNRGWTVIAEFKNE